MIDLDCPHCQSNMIKSYESQAKFRMKLLYWNKNGMYAVCKSCGKDVGISTDLLKSIQSSFVYEVTPKEKSVHLQCVVRNNK